MLGGLRFLLGLLLPVIAWQGEQTLFIIVLVIAFFLDAVDGPIARHYHQATVQGSRLDSVADFTVYFSLVISVWWLWPELFRREIVFICLATLSILVPVVAGLIKFHTITSYHTWLVKFATVCIAPGSVVLIMGGPAWPFQIASIVSVLAGLEQLIITLLLGQPRSDVRHIIAVMQRTRDNALPGKDR